MTIRIESPINKYYFQTLGMIFFPGAHFSESEELADGEPVLSVKTVEEENGIRAFVEASVPSPDPPGYECCRMRSRDP